MGEQTLKPIDPSTLNLLHGSFVDLDNSEVNKRGEHMYLAICGNCKKERMVVRTVLLRGARGGTPFTGLCRHCHLSLYPRRNGNKGLRSHNFHGGRHVGTQGYIQVLLSMIPEEHQEIARAMSYKRENRYGTAYIQEHRLVMAIHLGRPLLPTEIVHHRNGNRADNRLENLHLYTIRREHHAGHGEDYQKWQEALSENERLRQLVISLGGNPD